MKKSHLTAGLALILSALIAVHLPITGGNEGDKQTAKGDSLGHINDAWLILVLKYLVTSG